jgi:hypothetical protein
VISLPQPDSDPVATRFRQRTSTPAVPSMVEAILSARNKAGPGKVSISTATERVRVGCAHIIDGTISISISFVIVLLRFF